MTGLFQDSKTQFWPGMVVHTSNPCIQEAEAAGSLDLCEFKASMVYKESSRTARVVIRNLV